MKNSLVNSVKCKNLVWELGTSQSKNVYQQIAQQIKLILITNANLMAVLLDINTSQKVDCAFRNLNSRIVKLIKSKKSN